MAMQNILQIFVKKKSIAALSFFASFICVTCRQCWCVENVIQLKILRKLHFPATVWILSSSVGKRHHIVSFLLRQESFCPGKLSSKIMPFCMTLDFWKYCGNGSISINSHYQFNSALSTFSLIYHDMGRVYYFYNLSYFYGKNRFLIRKNVCK